MAQPFDLVLAGGTVVNHDGAHRAEVTRHLLEANGCGHGWLRIPSQFCGRPSSTLPGTFPRLRGEGKSWRRFPHLDRVMMSLGHVPFPRLREEG